MRRVAEIIHIVDSQRDDFINGAINPDKETQEALWLCGVRRQQYFSLNDLIFMTFEYEGNNFSDDMKKMAKYLDQKNLLVKQRRKDVPANMLNTSNWWAPVKRLGSVLITNPNTEDENSHNLMAMLDGAMTGGDDYSDIAYDEDDWSTFRF